MATQVDKHEMKFISAKTYSFITEGKNIIHHLITFALLFYLFTLLLVSNTIIETM